MHVDACRDHVRLLLAAHTNKHVVMKTSRYNQACGLVSCNHSQQYMHANTTICFERLTQPLTQPDLSGDSGQRWHCEIYLLFAGKWLEGCIKGGLQAPYLPVQLGIQFTQKQFAQDAVNPCFVSFSAAVGNSIDLQERVAQNTDVVFFKLAKNEFCRILNLVGVNCFHNGC